MSNDRRENNSPPAADISRNRRNSVTSAAFSTLFQKSNTTGTPVFPASANNGNAAMNDQRRRLSISTVGLSGMSAADRSAFGLRRGSQSTNNSDSLDESAIDEDEAGTNPRTAPTTPFARRMSFGAQAMRNMRTGSVNNTTTPGSANDQGFNWSEQLRSRAESNVALGQRPSFSFASGFSGSPPRASAGPPGPSPPHHDRAKSVSDMPAPPAQAPRPPRQDTRPKPDHFQERILKGDFYMD